MFLYVASHKLQEEGCKKQDVSFLLQSNYQTNIKNALAAVPKGHFPRRRFLSQILRRGRRREHCKKQTFARSLIFPL